MEQNANALAPRVVITLSHAIVNDATTFLPGRKSLQPPSQTTPIVPNLPASSTPLPIQASTESASPAIVPSQLPRPSSSSIATIIATTSTSSAESTLASSTSTEAVSVSEIIASTSSIAASASAVVPTTTAALVETSASPLAEASQALGQEKGQGEKAEKDAVATVPPPNNRGVAIGIAFGAVAGFSIAILAAVIIYKLRRKQRPKTGIKQFQ